MKPVFSKTKISETKHIHPWFKAGILKRWPDAYIYKPPAGQYGKKGAHDFFICIQGKFFSIELKTEIGKMSPAQQKTMGEVRKAGGYSMCVFGKDESIFDRIDQWLKG